MLIRWTGTAAYYGAATVQTTVQTFGRTTRIIAACAYIQVISRYPKDMTELSAYQIFYIPMPPAKRTYSAIGFY